MLKQKKNVHFHLQCLVKPPVKENTRPVDLVLHSDVRAVERAEFDNQVVFSSHIFERKQILHKHCLGSKEKPKNLNPCSVLVNEGSREVESDRAVQDG